jgi:large subunit ribosomal protein L10
MSKRIKELLVTDLQQRIGDTSEMLVVDSSRLDAISDNRFRLGLREKDIRILTVKNSMALRALHSAEVTALDPILEGPSSLVFGGEDIVSLSKEVAGWARELGDGLLEIKGGMLEGITLSASDVDELSKSPSREELIGQIAGLLLSPGATIAGSLLGPGGLVAGSIEAIADGEAEEETEEAAVEEADTGEEETGAAEEPEVASEEPEAAAEEPEAASEEPEAAAEADSDADGEGGQEPESEESEA